MVDFYVGYDDWKVGAVGSVGVSPASVGTTEISRKCGFSYVDECRTVVRCNRDGRTPKRADEGRSIERCGRDAHTPKEYTPKEYGVAVED